MNYREDVKNVEIELRCICKFCSKQFKSHHGRNGHEPYCSLNPNKKDAWNKNLTKETDTRLQQMSDSVKKTQNDIEWINSTGIRKKEKIKATKNENPSTSWNKGLTKETDIRLLKTSVSIKESWRVKPIEEKEILRKRQRDITLKRIIDHPNKRFSNTKPERLFKKFLDDLQIKYNHNYPIWGIEHSYPADFFLPDYNIVIEVDGKKWHNFPTYTDKDLIREIELNNKGYVLFRIWEDMVEIIAEIPEVFLEYLEAIKKDFTGTILNKKLY